MPRLNFRLVQNSSPWCMTPHTKPKSSRQPIAGNGGTCREHYAKADQSGMVARPMVEALLVALLQRPENFRHLGKERAAQLRSFCFKLLLKLPHFDLQAPCGGMNAIIVIVLAAIVAAEIWWVVRWPKG